jgi:hypothetical protein
MDFKILNEAGETLGYVVNTTDSSKAKEKALDAYPHTYFDIEMTRELLVPANLINCTLDYNTCQQFVLDKIKTSWQRQLVAR